MTDTTTPDKQAAPSEWVERAMELAHDSRCAAPGGVFAADQALLAHLESREALVKQLAEALKWMVQRADEGGYPDGRCLMSARAALADYQEKT